MLSRPLGARRSLSRLLGALLTGPAAFLLAGLIDFTSGLRLGLMYLWRSARDPLARAHSRRDRSP